MICLGAIEDDGDRRPDQLLLDPFLDASGAALDLFELRFVVERGGLSVSAHHPGVPHLHDAVDVAIVVEAEEYLSCQFALLRHEIENASSNRWSGVVGEDLRKMINTDQAIRR